MKVSVDQYCINVSDLQKSLDFYEKAFDERCWNLVFLNVDPVYNSLRGEARFERLIEKMEFPTAL